MLTCVRRASPLIGLVGIAGALAATALVGARATARNLGWYRRLRKPSWTPPDAAFGPVQTGLYALMGASAWRIWRSRSSPARTRALGLWAAQLAANGAWSPLFFGAHRPRAALLDLGLTLGAVGAYAAAARRVDRAAAWLIAPYVLWTLFAGVLNGAIVRQNPRRDDRLWN
jgi:tryptophan-rich sensory protein